MWLENGALWEWHVSLLFLYFIIICSHHACQGHSRVQGRDWCATGSHSSPSTPRHSCLPEVCVCTGSQIWLVEARVSNRPTVASGDHRWLNPTTGRNILSVCWSVFLSFCLPVCLPVFLLVRLSVVCLSICLPACLLAYSYACLSACLLPCLSDSQCSPSVYLPDAHT